MDNLVLDIKFDNTGTEPVTLDDAKNWLKIDVTDDDDLLTDLITAAREDCEGFLNISLIERTVTAYLQIGLGEIRLPYGPVQEVLSVSNSATGELIDSFTLKYEMFKSLDTCTEVTTSYTAGYNGNIPRQFKIAIMNQIAWLYEHRGDETDINTQISPQAMRILKPHRRVV